MTSRKAAMFDVRCFRLRYGVTGEQLKLEQR
jgi:hypothetical protein